MFWLVYIEIDFSSFFLLVSFQLPIHTPVVMTLWEDLLGSTVKNAALIVSRARFSSDPNVSAEVNAEWTYQELEAVLVDGFVQKGLLHKHESGYVHLKFVLCLIFLVQ